LYKVQQYVLFEHNDSTEGASVVTHDIFMEHFQAFTHFSFEDFDFTNVCMIGGCIAACLLPIPEIDQDPVYDTRLQRMVTYFEQDPRYIDADIDIFLYGIRNPNDLCQKIHDIYKFFYKKRQGDLLVLRTPNTVTLVSNKPYKKIQIVLRMFSSIMEILTNVDIDCAAVGFTGTKLWASPRARIAYNFRVSVRVQ
jgi:hypothetical protein